MIWNAERECADRQQMHELQSSQLTAMIERLYNNVPFYRNKLKEAGVEPGDIRSVDQLKQLPFTTKTDLRIIIRLGCLPCRNRMWYVFMHRAALLVNRRWWAIRNTILKYGLRWWRAA